MSVSVGSADSSSTSLVVGLRVLGEATESVAEEFGISPAAVRQARSRVLRRLRQQLGDVA